MSLSQFLLFLFDYIDAIVAPKNTHTQHNGGTDLSGDRTISWYFAVRLRVSPPPLFTFPSRLMLGHYFFHPQNSVRRARNMYLRTRKICPTSRSSLALCTHPQERDITK